MALLLSCTLLASFVLTASAQRQGQGGADTQQAEQSLDSFDLTDYDDISIDGPLDADEVTIGGSGAQADTPSTYSAGQFTTPTFYWSDSLTADDPTDFYFFSLTDTRDVYFKTNSSNSNVIAMFCIVNWSTGDIYPTDVSTSANSGRKGLLGVPAGDYALYVHTANNSTANYQLAYNGTTLPGSTKRIYETEDLSLMFFMYPNNIMRYNGTAVNIRSNVHYSYTESWPEGSGDRLYSYDVEGVPEAAILGSYDSTLVKSDFAIFYQMPIGTKFLTSTQNTSAMFETYDQNDLRGIHTPRKFDKTDVTVSDNLLEGWGPQYVVYDILSGQCIAFPSKLNIVYFTGGQKINEIKKFATLYGDPQGLS